ncbi:hypothetical protein DPMN_074809 [Dreissena polymorpha]|uniref:Uncharacterized protein n=1 Tax=Dreissena polymorpha TaxID=45954 RepID=A0A9D3YFN8_DREPO|nr:hypothetical protein DPMN_074809 [Dreissena polymorpha]
MSLSPMEILNVQLHYLRKQNVKLDGGEQTSLTDAHLCPKDVTILSIEKYCCAGSMFEQVIDDSHQPFVNVET